MKASRLLLIVLSLILLSACSTAEPETLTVRVGLLPILDGLPIHAADALGYFEDEGIAVEIVPVSSGPERDQLMQSGQIDAMINELVSVMFFNQAEPQVIAVRFARTASSDTPLFSILAAPESGLQRAEALAGIEIAVSEATVIEYTTERMLQAAGLSEDEIATIAVPKIPDRLNLLIAGQLQAAALPEPAVTVAALNGAQLVVDDTLIPDLSHSLITFDLDYVSDHPEVVRGFLRAVERAVEAINADPDAWGELLVERSLLAPDLVDVIDLPGYPAAGVPDETAFADAYHWAQEKGYLETEIAYDNCVTDAYLP